MTSSQQSATDRTEIDRANLILTIKTTQEAEIKALKLNKNRYIPPRTPVYQSHETNSDTGSGDGTEKDLAHKLQLTFNDPPQDTTKGFAFGTEKKRCDVFLGDKRQDGISGVHFYITLDKDGRVLLKDKSRLGTIVSYNGWGGEEEYRRCHFQWILFPDAGPEFKIHLPHRFTFDVVLETDNSAQRQENARTFNDDSTPQFGGLSLPTRDQTQSNTPRTPQKPIYLPGKTLGKGGFAIVDRVRDVSTGKIYAAKTLLPHRQKFLPKFRREAKILKDLDHVSSFTPFHHWATSLVML